MRLAITALLLAVAAPAGAQGVPDQCRAGCAALPRDDRPRVLACLQRCGVAVQQPARGRLTQGSGYGRPAVLPVAPPMAQPAGPLPNRFRTRAAAG
jgi:hypothetical protein